MRMGCLAYWTQIAITMLFASAAHAATPAPATPAPAVTVVPVQVQNVAPENTFIGRVTPIQSVQVVPRVTAFIEDVPVQEGSDVKAGQVLFQLQKTQYQAAVQAAQAQLDSAKAALQNAQLAYERAEQLVKQDVGTQANLDQ